MRKFVTLLQAAIVVLATLQCAQAGGLNIDHPYGDQIEGWRIGYSNLINGCVAADSISDRYIGLTTLWLGLGDSRIGAYLAFTNPNWNWVEVGKTYELTLVTAPYTRWRGNFVGIQTDSAKGLASLALNVGFQYEIARAYVLSVDFGPAVALFPTERTTLSIALRGRAPRFKPRGSAKASAARSPICQTRAAPAARWALSPMSLG